MVEFDLPESWWCAGLATRFPGLEVEFLNLVPTGPGRATETIRLTGHHAPEAVAWMRRTELLSRALVMSQEPGGAVVRLQIAQEPLVAALEAARLVPLFPFAAQGGSVRWLLVDEPVLIEAFMARMKTSGMPVRIVRRGEWASAGSTLTSRQQEIFQAALDFGYYNHPRAITLTMLARQLGIAKSTLSESLMTIESKVMHAHIDSGGAMESPRGRGKGNSTGSEA